MRQHLKRFSNFKTQATAVAFAMAFGVAAGVQAQQAPAALVEVAEASTEQMAPHSLVPGTVVSRNDSRISAEITGQITWVAPEGTLVKAGDVVAEIDARNIELTAERNGSEVKRLEARLKFLQSDLDRIRELAQTQHTPTSRVEQAESDLAMTEQQLVQARVALKQSEIDLARASVRAPFPGRVVARLAQVGEYSVPGRQIVRLVDTENLEVMAQAPVDLAAVLADGMAVHFEKEGTSHASAIRAMIPVGDTVSRTMEIRVEIPANVWYVVGTPVQVAVPSSRPTNVVAVPRDALVLRSEGTYVFRVKDDNTAERLLVRTGTANGDRVAVLGDIQGGDRVVVRGGERLRPGQSVQLQDVAITGR